MQNEIAAVERQVQDVRFTLQTAGVMRQGGSVPVPGNAPASSVFAALSSKMSESELFALKDAAGRVGAQLSTTSDGPGLVLFDEDGAITVALLSTPSGPELRMVDAEGNLQTVVSGQQ
jgi:hypothetical protein